MYFERFGLNNPSCILEYCNVEIENVWPHYVSEAHFSNSH